MAKNAGKAAVRCTSIDARGLSAMESHGKRLDKSSERRKVRSVDPLVYKGLDLSALFDAHMDGVTQNKGANKPTLHFVIRFPPDLLAGPTIGKFEGDKEKRQTQMLTQAVDFVNRTHGGDAVYAARVDRDEAGETIVDVFAAPKYEKRTKRTKADEVGATWASATKFGRELTEKHQDEIRARHPESKGGLHGPRMVGIALQSEFATYFREVNGIPLAPKKLKKTFLDDRLEIEAYKEIQAARDEIAIERTNLSTEKEQHGRIERRADIQSRWNTRRSSRLDSRAEDLDRKSDQLAEDRSNLSIEYADLEQERSNLRRVWSMVRDVGNRVGKMLGIDFQTDADYRSLAKDMMTLDRTIKEASAPRAEDSIPDADGDGPGF